MRYDSLKASYQKAITELEQREKEIDQLNVVLAIEREESTTKISYLTQQFNIANESRVKALKTIQRQQKKRFVFGPSASYGVSDNGVGINIGLSLTYKLISF